MNANGQRKSWLSILATGLLVGLTIAASAGAAGEDGPYAVSLRLEREKVSDGIRFWLTGSVDPFEAGSVGQTIFLSIVGPQGRVLFDGQVPLDEQGSYRYEFHFQQDLTDLPFHLRGTGSTAGVYHVSAAYGQANSEALIPVLPPIGSAIIVAGYGGHTCNHMTGRYEDVQKTVNGLAEYAYTVLRWSLCLPRDRIYLLHPDLAADCDLDGQPDVDALPTPENLRFAIEDWALERFCTSGQDDVRHSPLTIYVVSGCAGPGVFYINEDEPVWAEDVASWLSTLKAGIDWGQVAAGVPAYPLLPATAILEFPMSGSFVQELAMSNPGLAIMASSADGSIVQCESHIAEAGGLMSFSHQFWNRVFLGLSVGCAWTGAKQFTLSQYDDQNPQLCADGNTTANQVSDEVIASSQYLQGGGAGGFSVWGEVRVATGNSSLSLVHSCVLGESVELKACIRHAIAAQNCTVYAVAFPPAGVTKPNVILELKYSHELQSYVGTLQAGLTATGKWELLYVAVDANGHIAVTSHEVVVVAANIDLDVPVCPGDDWNWPSDYADLLDTLAGATPRDLDWLADIINQATRCSSVTAGRRHMVCPLPDAAAITSDRASLDAPKSDARDSDVWDTILDGDIAMPGLGTDDRADAIISSLRD